MTEPRDSELTPQAEPTVSQPEPDAPAPALAQPAPHTPWLRPSPLGFLPNLIGSGGSILTTVVAVYMVGRGALDWRTALGAIIIVAKVISAIVTTFAIRFRLHEGAVERRNVLGSRSVTTVPASRIRSVDTEQSFLQRLVGLATVTIATGGDGRIKLNDVTRSDADRLNAAVEAQRLASTRRTGTADAPPAEVPPAEVTTFENGRHVDVDAMTAGPQAAQPSAEPGVTVTRLDRTWLWRMGFAGAGILPVLLPFVALGRLNSELGGFVERLLVRMPLVVDGLRAIRRSVDQLSHQPFQMVSWVLGTVVLVLVLSYPFNILWYVIANKDFALVRKASGTLQSTRGMFSTRTASIDEHRMRGVVVSDGVLSRAVGLAKLRAVLTSGEDAETTKSSNELMPQAPAREVMRVAALLAKLPELATGALLLRPHGPKAARRLIIGHVTGTWFIWAVIGFGWYRWGWSEQWFVVAGVVTILEGLHAFYLHRSRGYQLFDRLLLVRNGLLFRKLQTVDHVGTLGFTINQGWMQQRLGIADVTLMDTGSGETLADLPPHAAGEVMRAIRPELVATLIAQTAAPATGADGPPTE